LSVISLDRISEAEYQLPRSKAIKYRFWLWFKGPHAWDIYYSKL